MNWLLLNAAPGSKIEQALEKLVDFIDGMKAHAAGLSRAENG